MTNNKKIIERAIKHYGIGYKGSLKNLQCVNSITEIKKPAFMVYNDEIELIRGDKVVDNMECIYDRNMYYPEYNMSERVRLYLVTFIDGRTMVIMNEAERGNSYRSLF